MCLGENCYSGSGEFWENTLEHARFILFHRMRFRKHSSPAITIKVWLRNRNFPFSPLGEGVFCSLSGKLWKTS